MIHLLLLCAAGVNQAQASYSLKYDESKLAAYLVMRPEDTRSNEFSVTFVFKTHFQGVEKVIGTFDCGTSYGMPDTISCGEYAANGRSQVYVSISHGEINSWIIDCDGKKIRAIYKNTGGRVRTLLGYDEKRGFYIDEHERPNRKRVYIEQLIKRRE